MARRHGQAERPPGPPAEDERGLRGLIAHAASLQNRAQPCFGAQQTVAIVMRPTRDSRKPSSFMRNGFGPLRLKGE